MWRSLLVEQVGAYAVADWEAMLSGALLAPADDAFGACFVRRPVASGDFDLGFAQPNAVRAGKTIAGVRAGGAADLAGCATATRSRRTSTSTPLAEAYHRAITIAVRRGGTLRSVTYDPHRGTASYRQWQPRFGNADAPCGRGAAMGHAASPQPR